MNTLVEDFLQFLRHERGQSEHTQKTYAALLNRFVKWAQSKGVKDWLSVKFSDLTDYLLSESERTFAAPGRPPKNGKDRKTAKPDSPAN